VAIFWSLLQTPLRCIFYRKTCPPSKIPLGQLPIPQLLPKNLVLIPPPRPAIGTSKIRIGVQPFISTQTTAILRRKRTLARRLGVLVTSKVNSTYNFTPPAKFPAQVRNYCGQYELFSERLPKHKFCIPGHIASSKIVTT
jgi:hypothetical protein